MFKEFKNKEKIKVRLRCPQCGSDFRVLVAVCPMINGFPIVGIPTFLNIDCLFGFNIDEHTPYMCKVMCHCGFLENKTFSYNQLEELE